MKKVLVLIISVVSIFTLSATSAFALQVKDESIVTEEFYKKSEEKIKQDKAEKRASLGIFLEDFLSE